MEGDFIKIRESLLPLSWFYGLGVGVRNFCFDVGLLKSRSFHVPVISVGNITVGGTGKTPHVEYLVALLKERFRVAVLSRGYKRKTRGFFLAGENPTVHDIGDEPCQIKRKFPDVTVAVDGKRVRGIERLMDDDRRLDVILLDDAFQHRYVKPGVNILLVDYHRLIIYDKLLPAGRLREPMKGKCRADVVIVTKCPKELKPMEFRVITKAMNLYPYQQLFFTTIDYGELQPLFPEAVSAPLGLGAVKNALLVIGIASPRQIQEDLAPHISHIESLSFPDHHQFRPKDVVRINEAFASMEGPKIVITTEKDAVRLSTVEGLSDEVRRSLFVLPVSVRFMQEEQRKKFDDFMAGYVFKNSRHSILAKGKEKDDGNRADAAGGSNTISFK